MKYFIYTLLAVVVLASCSKKPSNTASTANILRSGKWKFSDGSITLKLPSGIDTTIALLPFIPTCHQDDYIKFDSGLTGSVFSGAVKCFASDADSIGFVWGVLNEGSGINIYNGYNLIFMVSDSIVTRYLDTLNYNPLILDTLSHNPTVIDTIYPVKYAGIPTTNININNGVLSNVSTSKFTMRYDIVTTSIDTSVTHRWAPVYRPDTFHYSVTYQNF